MECVVECVVDQTARYRTHYRHSWRWAFRFDVHYRCRVLRELMRDPLIDFANASVLEVGFGTGHLLRCFPPGCRLHGAEVSESAVRNAQNDPVYRQWKSSSFTPVAEDSPATIPAGPFDVAVSSHTLEHVPDDGAHLLALHRRLRPGGWLLLFVPIEEPGYNPDHVRAYSRDSIAKLVTDAGFEIATQEDSMYIKGHVWKYLTIPSRRRWPLLGTLVNALRLALFSMLPYRVIRLMDGALRRVGVGPRQSFVLARAR